MTRRRADWWDEDGQADYTLGHYTTGLPAETDANGTPIPVSEPRPIGFVTVFPKFEKPRKRTRKAGVKPGA